MAILMVVSQFPLAAPMRTDASENAAATHQPIQAAAVPAQVGDEGLEDSSADVQATAMPEVVYVEQAQPQVQTQVVQQQVQQPVQTQPEPQVQPEPQQQAQPQIEPRVLQDTQAQQPADTQDDQKPTPVTGYKSTLSSDQYTPPDTQDVQIVVNPSQPDQPGQSAGSDDNPAVDEGQKQGGTSSGTGNSPENSSSSTESALLTIGTTSGYYATINGTTSYFLTSSDSLEVTASSDAPEGATVYYTMSSAAIKDYSASKTFDFAAEDSGWYEYTGPAAVAWQYGDYTNVAAVLVDQDGAQVDGSFASASLWNLQQAKQDIGLYGGITNYNIRMHESFNLAQASDANIVPTFYINVGVGSEPGNPTASSYDYAVGDGEPAYIYQLLQGFAGTVNVHYKGICVYSDAAGTPIATSDVLSDYDPVRIEAGITFAGTPGNTSTQYYPGTVAITASYNGTYSDIYYAIGTAGSTSSLDGWTLYDDGVTVSADDCSGDVALFAILYDPAAGAMFTTNSGQTKVWQTQLVRMGKTSITTSSGVGWLAEGDTISLSTSSVPTGYTSTIYYTVDGSDPSTSSSKYEGTMTLNFEKGDNVTIKAFSVLTNGSETIQGDVVSQSYKVSAAAPAISVRDGVVTITPSEGTAYYTTDMTDPVTSGSSIAYSSPFATGELSRVLTTASSADGVLFTPPSQLLIQGSGVQLGTIEAGTTVSKSYTFDIGLAGTFNNGDHVVQDLTFTLSQPATISFDATVAVLSGDAQGYSLQLLDQSGKVAAALVESFAQGASEHHFAQEPGNTLQPGTYILHVSPAIGAANAAYTITVSGLSAALPDGVTDEGQGQPAADDASAEPAANAASSQSADTSSDGTSDGTGSMGLTEVATQGTGDDPDADDPDADDPAADVPAADADDPDADDPDADDPADAASAKLTDSATPINLGTDIVPPMSVAQTYSFDVSNSAPQAVTFSLTKPAAFSFKAVGTLDNGSTADFSVSLQDSDSNYLNLMYSQTGSNPTRTYSLSTYSGQDPSLPAGSYTLTFSVYSSEDTVSIQMSDFTFTTMDQVTFATTSSRYYVDYDPQTYVLPLEKLTGDYIGGIYLHAPDSSATIYYEYTTGATEPSDPTLSSQSVTSGNWVASVGYDNPTIAIKAAVYDSATGTLGTVFFAKYAYIVVPTMFGVDSTGARTTVGYSSLDGSNDVLYDVVGKLGMSDVGTAITTLFPALRLSTTTPWHLTDILTIPFPMERLQAALANSFRAPQ